ncbi:MAG: T9SS type A sorting domain-containing protein [Bacteroidales bacterium]|nr:T9SS type A sorting domain-containing protein [Bacteroidales bacterium]
MKNKLLLLTALLFTFAIANAQFTVLLVDDDANSYDEWSYVETALINSGYTYDTINIDTNAAPDFATLNNFDMVIWHTANDGLNLNLWDTTATVQFNAAIREFLDSNGVLWVDGLDFMYDQFGSAPVDFAAGDFVYDVMGISKYACQSHADDTVGTYSGLTLALPAATNTITTIDSIQWKWSSLWYGDGFEITNEAIALFEMGPADYDFAGMVNGLYKENVITTSLRISSLGDGGSRVQSDIDLLVKEMIEAAEAGTFVKDDSYVNSIEAEMDVVLYPNPATDMVTLTFNSVQNASIKIFDITGKMVISDEIANNATKYTFNVSSLNAGMYFYQITLNNATVSNKFSVVK